MIGTLAGLNVGEGDLTLSFDKSNPLERERAAKIVRDMIKRGYAVLVQIDVQLVDEREVPVYRRAHDFDPETCEYIVAGGPDERIDIGDFVEQPRSKKKKKGKVRKVRVPAEKTRAVAVSRSAGG